MLHVLTLDVGHKQDGEMGKKLASWSSACISSCKIRGFHSTSEEQYGFKVVLWAWLVCVSGEKGACSERGVASWHGVLQTERAFQSDHAHAQIHSFCLPEPS